MINVFGFHTEILIITGIICKQMKNIASYAMDLGRV